MIMGIDIINKLHLGNCLDIMSDMPDSCIDLTVTSPPYDSLRKYNGYVFEFESIAQQLLRVTKPGGVIVWVVGDETKNGSETGTSFRQALYFKEIGFNIHDTMIYEKNTSAFPARKNDVRYSQVFEFMFVLSKGKPKTVNLIRDKKNRWNGWRPWGKSEKRTHDGQIENNIQSEVYDYGARNNIWGYVVGGGIGNEKDAYDHPATFPIDLARDHIESWSKKEDLVFDPFMGSGTTALASIDMDRNWLGCEISEEYYKISMTRIENHIKETVKRRLQHPYYDFNDIWPEDSDGA